MTPATAPRARRAPLRALVPAIVALVAVAVPLAPAAAAPVPGPKPLPAQIEPFPEYQGATLCDPVAHSGPKALKALLTATYGTTSYGITRSCSGTTGSSEHNEGRALDWMVSGSTQKADAKAFLTWLFATDSAGNTYAMARRMGIMYVVWNNKMFRLYDTDRGWTEYNGCLSLPGSAYDTTCHRNHVHFSFTWDGALAATSYWSGTAVTAPACGRAPTAAVAPAVTTQGLEFVPLQPYRALDTAAGVGVPDRCRLTQDGWSGENRRIDMQIGGAGGVPATGVVAVALALQVAGPNAPTMVLAAPTGSTKALRVVTAAMNVDSAGSTVIPLGSGGRVSLTLSTGAADVAVDVLGYYKVADGTGQRFHPTKPARVLNTVSARAPLQPGETRSVRVAGLGGVPGSGASAVTVALTVYDPPQSGGVTLYGGGDDAPPTGQLSLTSPAHGWRTNLLLARLDASGTVVVRNDDTGPRDVTLDVAGWWAPSSVAGGSVFRYRSPVKVVDTASDLGVVDALRAGSPASVPLAGVGGIPASGVTAVALQATMLRSTARTAVAVWPAGGSAAAVRMVSVNKKADHTALLVAPLSGGRVAVSTSSGTLGVRSYAVGYWYVP
jgi:hypothetical protein